MVGAAIALSLAVFLQPPPWKVFAQAGDKIRAVDYLIAYSWIAAALNMVILVVLALVCPWWANAPAPSAPSMRGKNKAPRWFWPAVLAAVAACSALTVPRLTQSLWDDEETSLRFYVLGRHKRSAEDGQIRLKEVRWRETLFLYDTPNNHVLYNTLARVANSAWRAATKPGPLQFAEWALRLPAFLAGLAALIGVAAIFKDIGMPGAGALASWMLALHPWFGKYCAEARGYSMAMLFVCAALLFWRRALISGRWTWWALSALSQVLCLWTWPGALAFFAILNAGTVVVIFSAPGTALPHRTVLSRWFCCNALAGVILMQLMLPLVPQMKAYLAHTPKIHNVAPWSADAGCYLATGSPWSAENPAAPERAEIKSAAADFPQLFAVALAAGTLLVVWGAAEAVKRGGMPGGVAVAAVTGAAVVQILEVAQAHMFVFAWYLAYLLPLFAGAFACGLAALAVSLRKLPLGRLTAPTVVGAAFALFFFVTQPARARGLSCSTEPVRESVLLTRPDLQHGSAQNKAIITVGMTDPPFVYDPNIFWARTTRDLLLLCLQADTQKRPLWLNLGHTWLIRENAPRTQELLDAPAFFADRKILRSEFPHCDRTVMRYVPGSATQADLSRFLDAGDLAHIRENAGVAPEQYFAR